jgi:hypothetical protein
MYVVHKKFIIHVVQKGWIVVGEKQKTMLHEK